MKFSSILKKFHHDCNMNLQITHVSNIVLLDNSNCPLIICKCKCIVCDKYKQILIRLTEDVYNNHKDKLTVCSSIKKIKS